MRFAYADPPYLGLARFYAHLHPQALAYDDPATHRALIDRLARDYPDGWALSLHVPSLQTILPMCPPQARVMAWVKPFCSFKPGVGVAYAWEPVIVCGGRRRTRAQETVRDWCAANITLRRGLTGAKPARFTDWLLDVLNVQAGDAVDDLFPGTGAVSRVLEARLSRPRQIDLVPA